MNRGGLGVVETAAPPRLDGLKHLRDLVEERLPALVPGAGSGSPLAEAAAYALLAPGKRTRPVMTLLCARRFGGSVEAALDAACAFEMVHAASLVFDDLPCMDNAMQRRGRTTTHLTFGEDAAVLAA
jgi:geranylgeranyl diphosphate synthase type II